MGFFHDLLRIILFVSILYVGGCLFESSPTSENCPVIHRDYDQPPKLKKGYDEAIEQRLQYPELARKAGIEGRVYMTVNTNSKGEVLGTHIIRGIGGGCDEEAQRVVSTAEFNPARKNNRTVCAQDTMYVVFRLDN